MSNEPTSTLLAAWANAFQSTNRLLKLILGSPSEHLTSKLLVASFTAKETLSSCPEYVITLLSDDAHIELKSLLGVPATLQLLTDQSTQDNSRTWQDSHTQYRTFNGIIYNVQQLGSNGGFAKYQITVVPAFKLLSLRRNNRVIQDKTVPDIINLILKEHQPGNPLLQWQLHLSDTHPTRSYCVQYRESDLAFLERLMREEGMYYYITHPDSGEPGQHTLTITDDHYSLNTNPAQSIRFHRSDATESSDSITQWQARRTLKSGHVALASFDYKTVQTIVSNEPTNQHQGDAANPLSAHLEHYEPQTAYYGTQQADLDRYTRLRIEAMEAAAKTFNGKGTVRTLIPGTWFELEQHPIHDTDPVEQRQFVLTEVIHQGINNLGPDITTGMGNLISNPKQYNDGTYSNQFSTQRRSIPYRPEYNATLHAKPVSLGIQSAIVVGPAGEEIYTDALGRIKIQFHWQRPQDHSRDTTGSSAAFDEMSTCWVRVTASLSGQNYGELFLPRIGQEVLIDFVEGDIDRPVCFGRIYNASQTPPTFSNAGTLPNNKTLSGIKTKTYKAIGYNELLFDDTTKEERTKLSTEQGSTQYNIGYLVHPRSEGKAQPRGQGFELRSDAWGAIRAGYGLLISTDQRTGASSTHLDSTESNQQLQSSLNQSKAQSDLASQHHAEPLNANSSSEHLLKVAQSTHTQSGSTGVTHDVPAYSEPIINLSSPAGIIHTTPKSQIMSNGLDLHLTQGQDFNIATGRNMAASIQQSLSLFVAGVDSKTKQAVSSAMKLFAAKGKVEIQAHSDNIEMTAAKDVKLLSTLQNIDFAAAKSITITAGGAYIKLEGGNIDMHAPGKVSVKGALKTFDGPASMGYAMPVLPNMPDMDFKLHDEAFVVLDPTGNPIGALPHSIESAKGKYFADTNEKGNSHRTGTDASEPVTFAVQWLITNSKK